MPVHGTAMAFAYMVIAVNIIRNVRTPYVPGYQRNFIMMKGIR